MMAELVRDSSAGSRRPMAGAAATVAADRPEGPDGPEERRAISEVIEIVDVTKALRGPWYRMSEKHGTVAAAAAKKAAPAACRLELAAALLTFSRKRVPSRRWWG